jgi:DNA-binding IclR family transcriptional regulator
MKLPPGINLTKDEAALIDQAESAVAEQDAKQLHDLVPRLRRAKDKYTQLYRRQGAARVTEDRSRGMAADSGQRTEGKAEVFASVLDSVEDALAAAEAN